MRDGQQGVPFDRWLMRIKDVLLLLTAVFGLLWQGYKYVRSVEHKDTIIQQKDAIIQQQKTQLAIQRNQINVLRNKLLRK